MTIPPKYEDVVAQLDAAEVIIQAVEHVESHLEKQIDILRIDLDAAMGREAALREELESIKASVDGYDSPEHAAQVADEMCHQCSALQQRLTVAEHREEDLKKLLCDVINEAATGFAALKVDLANRVNDALKPAAEGEGS